MCTTDLVSQGGEVVVGLVHVGRDHEGSLEEGPCLQTHTHRHIRHGWAVGLHQPLLREGRRKGGREGGRK